MNARKEGRVVDHQRKRFVQVIDDRSEYGRPTRGGFRNATKRTGVGVTTAIPITVDHNVLIRAVLPVWVVEELPIGQTKPRLAIRPHDGASGKSLRLAVASNCPDALPIGKLSN